MNIASSMIEIIADRWKTVKVCVEGEGLSQGVSFPQLGSYLNWREGLVWDVRRLIFYLKVWTVLTASKQSI